MATETRTGTHREDLYCVGIRRVKYDPENGAIFLVRGGMGRVGPRMKIYHADLRTAPRAGGRGHTPILSTEDMSGEKLPL